MLTIATVPKPFRDSHINIIQRNAIQSWLKLFPKPQIILFGNDEGIAEAAKEFGVLHIPEVETDFGVPLLSSVFSLAQKISNNQFLAYINADIILMSDFMKALGLIKTPSFLMAGQRWDINIKKPIQFKKINWEQKLRQRAVREGKLHALSGMDYFVFPRNLQFNMPALIAGRPGYDSWLVYQARSVGIPVIDATKMVMVLHQSHDYSHHLKGEKGVWEGAEAKRNLKLVGGLTRMLTLRDTDWILNQDGLKRPEFSRRIFAKLSLFYPWRLLLLIKRRLQGLLKY